MRVVLDTNVFIAAALKSGLAEDILRIAATTNLITLVTSEEILSELRLKLLSKFDRAEEKVDFFIEEIKHISEVVKGEIKVDVVIRDPDDNKILECALAGKADLIVSSDQDLIRLKKFRGIGIVHPKTLGWTFPEYFKKKQN